ncbi:GNAT family N-acetyltransferase [Virgibacillus salarius]|uniref:GNAT family N-acetyltransferase n=1 Tax=Virgibacillus salarius TaxID=447199 RepID=A0A941IC79_9BACI|nr:GNAT family N-acetyltransferase [uncultured Virgibacillus sp.]MBR7797117.1 GNAT family N-acetyltransferase [Virgibacillus salarius]
MILTNEMALQIEQAEIDTLQSRLTAISHIQGNPMDADVRTFGNATAFTATKIPGPSFNTVKGLTDNDSDHLEEIIDFYQQKNIPLQFELTPAHVSNVVFDALASRGFYQKGFHTVLYGETAKLKRRQFPDITIKPIHIDNFNTFAHIYTKGFAMPDFLNPFIAENNAVLHKVPGWTFLLANSSNTPAGVGVLFTKNTIANLAAAATLPTDQNKGVHQALLQRRIQLAREANCKIIVGQATFGSVSQQNMQKAGMTIAYTKSVWRKK